MSSIMETYQYDVAISFAGEQRREAQAIAHCLLQAGVRVYFDEYEQASSWGKNLYEQFASIYEREAQYCLMLVSEAYAAKMWTTHERRCAQARAITEKSEYLLPVRFDETEIPGVLKTIGYLRFHEHGISGICQLLLQKLSRNLSSTAQSPHLNVNPETSSEDSNLRSGTRLHDILADYHDRASSDDES
jgi:hypothetical protein